MVTNVLHQKPGSPVSPPTPAYDSASGGEARSVVQNVLHTYIRATGGLGDVTARNLVCDG